MTERTPVSMSISTERARTACDRWRGPGRERPGPDLRRPGPSITKHDDFVRMIGSTTAVEPSRVDVVPYGKLGRSFARARAGSLHMATTAPIPAPETAELKRRLGAGLESARAAFAAEIRAGRGGRAAHELF